MVILDQDGNPLPGSRTSRARDRRPPQQRDRTQSRRGRRQLPRGRRSSSVHYSEPNHPPPPPPSFIDDISSESSFPPLRDSSEQSTFVNSFSQFNLSPTAVPLPPRDPIPELPEQISSLIITRPDQIDERLNQRVDNLSDGVNFPSANFGFTNSFTEDRMSRMGDLVSPKRTTHVVIGSVSCPVVEDLSLLRRRDRNFDGKVNFGKIKLG